MRGLILSTVKYGEKNVIVNVLTPDVGRHGYIIGLGSRRGGASSMLMPLADIYFETTGRGKTTLQRMRDVKFARPMGRIPFEPTLRAVAFFVTELLVRAVPDDVPDEALFEFVAEAVGQLDSGIGGSYNFHLYFMMRLADYMGFGVERVRGEAQFFDLQAGEWTSGIPLHRYFLSGREADIWSWLSTVEVDGLEGMKMSREERQLIIERLIEYYKFHLSGFVGLKSHEVLKSL